MENSERAKQPVTIARDLAWSDITTALAAGWRDFAACPQYALAISAVYVLAGIGIAYALVTHGQVVWLVPAVACFPLIAPFTAVGIYEVSRRREAGLPIGWIHVLGALRGRGDDQIMGLGVIIFVIVAFWVILAHGIFYIFLAQAGLTTESLAMLWTPAGMTMLVVGGAVGAAIALFTFCLTVMSLPTLIDRDVDLITAMIASWKTVGFNKPVMLGWALLIAVALFLASIPAFLGLLVVLPVLGHASWHLYRRAIG
ncbi:DUF2189 domain-containing protein [Alteraurantiacibacter aquimixticola]|uniref:DUF2189 domain-containing protein n=1 Tax=Alteraurantiacibacter aquimixticola TaxID=2489173 RepID=A0A4T3F6Z9_9SPHN|nr:DUF2189 domain-containing protein [Alteraurantiacibacter aquimixticola]TIX50636.1 DUF2189 domain-containing protein [Alteraurantiacibacter aquimixticola]